MAKSDSMMISAAMNARLNDQISVEFAAAFAYLAMACVFDAMGLKVLRERFLKQWDEEREHAMKIIRYLSEVGGSVTLKTIDKPRSDYKSVEAIVATALKNEKDVTTKINDLVALAEKEKDYATRSFLEWFVDEQVEEVSTMIDLLHLVKLAGPNVLQVESSLRHQLLAEKDED